MCGARSENSKGTSDDRYEISEATPVSLVNDALKRARTEAQERQALQSGVPLPPPAPERLSSNPGSKLLPILAMLGVVFLVGLLAGAITFVRNRAVNADARGSEPVAETRQVTNSSSGVAAPPAASSAPSSTVGGDSSSGHLSTQGTATGAEAKASPQQRPTRPAGAAARQDSSPDTATPRPPVPVPAPSTVPKKTTPQPQRSTAPAPAKASNSAKSSAEADDDSLPGEREATSADGRQLALGGIAWSETGPFALINGRVLAAGERVEGFKVIDIQKEQVELEDRGERIFLRLR